MDDVALGRRFRALRHRLGRRQEDLGAGAGLSQSTVSRTERGQLEAVSLPALRRHAKALGAELRISLWFRGAELDRLMDEGHATLVGAVLERLQALGWEAHPEVTFAVFADRGSIDVLAWHGATRTLLVVEVKTELVSIEETLRRLDVKVRNASKVATERFGWRPLRVTRLLVLPDDTTTRSHVRRHDTVLRRAFPTRGPLLRAWLHDPADAVGGLLFVPYTRGARARRPASARKRVHRRRASVN